MEKCFVTKSKDFVYVKDLAKAVVKACDGTGSGTHFSSGKDVSIKELYDEVVAMLMIILNLILKNWVLMMFIQAL